MATEIKAITIYGASSSKIDKVYIESAKKLGKLMAAQGVACVNGAGKLGMMGAINDSMLEEGGNVIGIIPQFMVDEGWAHDSMTEIIITSDMHTRKQLLAQKSCACIALPGGVGTLEELLEVITWKQLGLYKNPIIILNTNGYYDDLLAMFDKAAREQFMHHNHVTIWKVANTPEEAMEIISEGKEWYPNPRAFAAM